LLLLALPRLVEANEGSVTIDGVNLVVIGARDLRSSISITDERFSVHMNVFSDGSLSTTSPTNGEIW
jgi:ABC-type multidrug transport system fused ATPase/permease subunit